MRKFLTKIFLGKLDPQKDRAAVGKRSGIVGILCNLLLFGGKMLVGVPCPLRRTP